MSYSKIKLIPLYFLYLTTFGCVAWSKLASLLKGSFGAPDWFQKQFAATFLNLFPGALTLNFYFIATLESLVVLGLLISLARKEFFPESEKIFLRGSLLLAQVIFVILGLGLRLTQDFHGAAELFFYFGFTFFASVYIEQKLPNDQLNY